MVWWCWFRRDKTDQSVIYFKKYEIKTGLKVKGLAAQLLCGSTVISATVPHLGWFLLVPLVAVPGAWGQLRWKLKRATTQCPPIEKPKRQMKWLNTLWTQDTHKLYIQSSLLSVTPRSDQTQNGILVLAVTAVTLEHPVGVRPSYKDRHGHR